MEDEIGTPGLGVMAHGVDQMLADKRSATSYQREKSLMNKQNAMNLSNAMTMPSIQAHGLRMAGFNPAMVNGAGSQPAPTVSKGSADMAQTFPLDVGGLTQLALLNAQKENVEAQTEKTKAETVTEQGKPGLVASETDKNLAQISLFGEQQELTAEQKREVSERATQLAQTNEQYRNQNEAMQYYGQAVAIEWQGTDWYKKLGPQFKRIVDQMATGGIPMTMGAMEALQTYLRSAKDLDASDKQHAENALAKTIIDTQLNTPEILKAMSNDPKYRMENLRADTKLKDKTREKLEQEIPKVKDLIDAEIKNLVSQANKADKEGSVLDAQKEILDLEKKMKKMLNQSFEVTDPGYNMFQGRPIGYLGAMAQKLLEAAINAVGMVMTLLKGKEVLDNRTSGMKSVRPMNANELIEAAKNNEIPGIRFVRPDNSARTGTGVQNMQR